MQFTRVEDDIFNVSINNAWLAQCPKLLLVSWSALVRAGDTNTILEIRKDFTAEGLCKPVRVILRGHNFARVNHLSLDAFTNKMMTNLDMLGVPHVLSVLCPVSCGNIITVERSRSVNIHP